MWQAQGLTLHRLAGKRGRLPYNLFELASVAVLGAAADLDEAWVSA
jgi:hypothetical protein